MKKQLILAVMATSLSSLCLFACNSANTDGNNNSRDSISAATTTANRDGGFPSQAAWGEHLVNMGGCNDCHTPKIMTKMGPVPDTNMILAGHPANVPPPSINRKEIESKGLAVTNDLTVWIGPWGISYAANLTPDNTGLNNWTPDQFIRTFRELKMNGSPNARPLLPPMSFVAEGFSHTASDDELKAIFAYLQTIKPVHNAVPAPVPPVSTPKQ